MQAHVAGWSPRDAAPAKLCDLNPVPRPALLCLESTLLNGDAPMLLPLGAVGSAKPPPLVPFATTGLALVALLLVPASLRSASGDAVRAFRLSANGELNAGGAPAAAAGAAAEPLGKGACPVAVWYSAGCRGMPAMASGFPGGGRTTGTDSGRPSVCWLSGGVGLLSTAAAGLPSGTGCCGV